MTDLPSGRLTRSRPSTPKRIRIWLRSRLVGAAPEERTSRPAATRGGMALGALLALSTSAAVWAVIVAAIVVCKRGNP
jgi:hypothetical protein